MRTGHDDHVPGRVWARYAIRGWPPGDGVVSRADLSGSREQAVAALVHQVDRQCGTALGDQTRSRLVRADATGSGRVQFAVGTILAEQR